MDKKEIFVFGSNTEGRHGKGAALTALKQYGAKYGQAEGLQGSSYAIITKDLKKGVRSISLERIEYQIRVFLDFADEHQEYVFNVTKIGCGLGGYSEKEIGDIFRKHRAIIPLNVNLPEEFK